MIIKYFPTACKTEERTDHSVYPARIAARSRIQASVWDGEGQRSSSEPTGFARPSASAIYNKYDRKITDRLTPVMMADVPYIPLEFVVHLLGLAKGELTNLKHGTITMNGALMLPMPECQSVLGKSAVMDASGLIIIDDHPVYLTDSGIARAHRLIDSFANYDHAYWNANNTITMSHQAEMVRTLRHEDVPGCADCLKDRNDWLLMINL